MLKQTLARYELEIYWKYRRTMRAKRHAHLQRRRIKDSGEYGYRVFDENRAIFVHIPKCSGVSVCRTLVGNLAGDMLR